MDPLEQRIKALQDDLQQVEQPDQLAIWNRIATTRPVKSRRLPPRHWMAAAALVLVGACLGYWWHAVQSRPDNTASLADMPPEWQARVQEYQVLIGRKEQALQLNRPRGSTASDEFQELQLLDSLHRAFMADFAALPKDQRTEERLLHYYEQKIRILELILKATQIRQHEEERHAQRQI